MSYGAETTTDEVLDGIDLTGKHVVITGATSGLGAEATRALAAHGASVTMLARSQEKYDTAEAVVRETVPDAELWSGIVDLADFDSIRACTRDLLEQHGRIDVLMNNAGVMACPELQTADGFEMQFGTNHLGHFLLTAGLAPALMAAAAPRVVNLSSAGHTISDVNLDDINFETGDYDPWVAYGRSKTANALFSRGIARRFGDQGLLSFAVHPGGIRTNLGRHMTPEVTQSMLDRQKERADSGEGGESGQLKFKEVEAGAATQVWACVAPELADDNGAYLADCQLGVEGGNPLTTGFSSHILQDVQASDLWKISETLTGTIWS